MNRLLRELAVARRSAHARSVGSTAGALIAAQVMMGVAGVLAARSLGPSGRGIVTAVLAWPMLLAHLSLLGINSSATVRIAHKRAEGLATTLGSAVVYSIVAGGVVTLGAIAAIPSALDHLGPDAAMLSVWALATIPLILFSDILLSVNVALGRIVLANWCRLIGPVMIVTATVLLVLADEVTATRVVAVSVVAGVPPIVIGCLGLPWRHIAVKASELIADLKFGVKAHLASVLGIANFRLDLVFMSAFVSATQLGYYGVANNMMMPVMTIAQAAAMLLTPRVAGMGRGDDRGGVDDAQLARIRTDGRRFVWLGLAGAALVAALAPVAVPLVFGSAFEPVVVLVWVLLPGYIARNYAVIITAGALGARRPWVGNVVEGAGLVITVTLLPLLLPRYEAMGAAITSTVAYSASALVAVLAIRRIGRRMSRSTASAVDEAETGAPHATGAVTVRAG